MSKQLKTIYLDKDKLERLKKLSARTKIPQAVIIRAGIGHVFDGYEKQLKGEEQTKKSTTSENKED